MLHGDLAILLILLLSIYLAVSMNILIFAPASTIISQSATILMVLIVFVIQAKHYKYRVRENEVNIVQIVDDHYQKYMEQEETYEREENFAFDVVHFQA